jgi:outer membrane protein assembly factor BamE (lipoprotein component of BamABCDE complex)
MRNVMRLYRGTVALLTISALGLAGCASSGVKADPNVVSSFQPGVTTLADAEARLGAPSQSTHNSDGTTTLDYIFGSSKMSASTFIPVAGAFVGHSDTQTQITELQFDKNNLFVKSSQTEGQTRSGMGSSN